MSIRLLKVDDSSSIEGIAHDSENNQLHVRFKKTPALYVYDDISENEFQHIWLSQSRGQKLREIVKDKKFKKIAD